MDAIENVIAAAKENAATIVFPSRFYSVGPTDIPVSEDMESEPNSDQGRVFSAIEEILAEATEYEECRSIIVRHAHIFGPNIIDGLTDRVMKNANRKQAFQWVHDVSIPLQLTYGPDVAGIMIHLASRDDLEYSTLVNYAGSPFETVEEWMKLVADVADVPFSTNLDGWLKVQVLAPIQQDARACKDIFYTFENAVLLNDDKVRGMMDVHPTAMREAIAEALAWFSKKR